MRRLLRVSGAERISNIRGVDGWIAVKILW